MRVVVGAPADVRQHARVGVGAEGRKPWRTTRPPRASVRRRRRRPSAPRPAGAGGHRGEVGLDDVDARRAGQPARAAMPSLNCAGASRAAGSTSTRTTAVLMPASLSAGRKRPMTTPTTTELTTVDRRECGPASTPRLLRFATPVASRTTPSIATSRRLSRPLDDARPTARRGRPQRTARPRRRSVPARRQAAHRARRRPSGRRQPSCWPTARRANPRRSRTGGCSGNRPHLVLDGRAAGRARSSAPTHAVVYVSDPLAAEALGRRARRPHDARRLSIGVVTVEPGYVAGEETAAVRAVNGGPGQAHRQATAPVPGRRRRPPDAGQQRRDAAPTCRSSSATAARRSAPGTVASPGTFLATVTGAGRPAACTNCRTA